MTLHLAYILVLAILVVLLASPVSSTLCNTSQVWTQIAAFDVLASIAYGCQTDACRGPGIATCFEFYETYCALGKNVPFYPISACEYMNSGICERALAGNVNDALRVNDALLRFKHVFVSGTYNCPDPLQQPIVDKTTGTVMCMCPPHVKCILSSDGGTSVSSSSVSASSSSGTVSAASTTVDEPTSLADGTTWFLVAEQAVGIFLALGVASWSIWRTETWAKRKWDSNPD